MVSSKVLALGMGTVCVGAVVGMGIYLPFYSSAAKKGEEARRQLHGKGGAQGGGGVGGIWKNIDEF